MRMSQSNTIMDAVEHHILCEVQSDISYIYISLNKKITDKNNNIDKFLIKM